MATAGTLAMVKTVSSLGTPRPPLFSLTLILMALRVLLSCSLAHRISRIGVEIGGATAWQGEDGGGGVRGGSDHGAAHAADCESCPPLHTLLHGLTLIC